MDVLSWGEEAVPFGVGGVGSDRPSGLSFRSKGDVKGSLTRARPDTTGFEVRSSKIVDLVQDAKEAGCACPGTSWPID